MYFVGYFPEGLENKETKETKEKTETQMTEGKNEQSNKNGFLFLWNRSTKPQNEPKTFHIDGGKMSFDEEKVCLGDCAFICGQESGLCVSFSDPSTFQSGKNASASLPIIKL